MLKIETLKEFYIKYFNFITEMYNQKFIFLTYFFLYFFIDFYYNGKKRFINNEYNKGIIWEKQ